MAVRKLPKDVLKMASGLISPSGLAGHRRPLCSVALCEAGHLVVDGLGEGARALEPVDLGLVLGVVCERGHGLAAPQPAQHGHRGPGAAAITVHLHAAEARARGHVSGGRRSARWRRGTGGY